MKNDDFHVVAYKVLSGCYERLKNDQYADDSDIGAEAMGIPKGYWAFVMHALAKQGFVKGIKWSIANSVELGEDFGVTYKGVNYLFENESMKEAAEFVKKSEEVIKWTVE